MVILTYWGDTLTWWKQEMRKDNSIATTNITTFSIWQIKELIKPHRKGGMGLSLLSLFQYLLTILQWSNIPVSTSPLLHQEIHRVFSFLPNRYHTPDSNSGDSIASRVRSSLWETRLTEQLTQKRTQTLGLSIKPNTLSSCPVGK